MAGGSDTEGGGLSTSTGLANALSVSTGRSEGVTLAVLLQQPIGPGRWNGLYRWVFRFMKEILKNMAGIDFWD